MVELKGRGSKEGEGGVSLTQSVWVSMIVVAYIKYSRIHNHCLHLYVIHDMCGHYLIITCNLIKISNFKIKCAFSSCLIVLQYGVLRSAIAFGPKCSIF